MDKGRHREVESVKRNRQKERWIKGIDKGRHREVESVKRNRQKER